MYENVSVNVWQESKEKDIELFKRLKLSGQPETKADSLFDCAVPRLIQSQLNDDGHTREYVWEVTVMVDESDLFDNEGCAR